MKIGDKIICKKDIKSNAYTFLIDKCYTIRIINHWDKMIFITFDDQENGIWFTYDTNKLPLISDYFYNKIESDIKNNIFA
jgi:hypothetical protein